MIDKNKIEIQICNIIIFVRDLRGALAMKLKKFILFFFSVLLVGCSNSVDDIQQSTNSQEINPQSSLEQSTSSNIKHPSSDTVESTEQTDIVIENILEKVNATMLLHINYADDKNVYVTFRNDNSVKDDMTEYVVVSIDTSNGNIKELYRGFHKMDLEDSLNIGKTADGATVIFTGKAMLTVNGDDVQALALDIPIHGQATFNAKTNQLSYVDNDTSSLHVYDVANKKDTLICQAPENKMFYEPRLNADGTKILFQQVGATTVQYEKLMMSDINGKIIKEIEMEQVSDSMYHFWTQNGFARMYQPKKDTTVIINYDMNGEKIGEIQMDAYLVSQIYDVNNDKNINLIPSYNYDNGTSKIYSADFNTNTSKEIYATDKIITDAVISPDAKQMVWVDRKPDTIHIKAL